MKRKISIQIYIGVLITAFLITFIPEGKNQNGYIKASNSEYEEKLKEAEERLAELDRRVGQTQNSLAELEQAKGNIQKYIEKLDIQLNEVTLEIMDLKVKIEQTETELKQTKKELKEAKKTEANHYDTMKRRIKYMYENNDASYWDVILNADGLEDLLNQVEYMYRITEYDNNLLNRYIEAKKVVADREAKIEATLAQLESFEEAAEFEKEYLEQLVVDKNAEIERYTKEIGITDETLFEYLDEISNQKLSIDEIKEDEKKRLEEIERKKEEEEARLEKERLEREAREKEEKKKKEEQDKNNSNGNTSSGYDSSAADNLDQTDETSADKMIWPLPGDYRTFAKFGPRIAPTEGASTYHKGWDIGGEYGAPIVATLAGKVVNSGYNASSGNYVRIDHGNGLNTVYCHASKLLVAAGENVKQGQQLALIGSTGVSTGPHLHFAVTVDGVYVDPGNYIG